MWCIDKYTGKIIRPIRRVLIHYSFCVLNFTLAACRPNLGGFSASTDSVTNFLQPRIWAVKTESRYFYTSRLILHLIFDEANGIHTLQYRLHYNRLYLQGRRIAFVGFLITCSKSHKKSRLFVQCLFDTERRPLLGGRNATSEDHKLYS